MRPTKNLTFIFFFFFGDWDVTGSNANTSSARAKCNFAWDHVTKELKDRKSSYRCIHCGKVNK